MRRVRSVIAIMKTEEKLTAHTHHAPNFIRKYLLQLPHAAHNVGPDESNAKPYSEQPDGR